MKKTSKGKHYHLHLRDYRRGFTGRGARIASFATFRELKAKARKLSRAAGYPLRAWMDLYDWAQG